ncbi:MAG: aminodeoxychorismate synthase component I [Campylobacterales bacterium]
MNKHGEDRKPFFVLCDFELQNSLVLEEHELEQYGIRYEFDSKNTKKAEYNFNKFPISYELYKDAFLKVIEEIKSGNVYMLNLCFSTRLDTSLSLEDIYKHSEAKFKLYKKDDFVCFTPEIFVTIENDKISTYPMKGTIEATLKDAKKNLLEDEKELAEHVMVVDLLRNDIGIMGRDIRVESFRYIDEVQTSSKPLLQCSSKISASLSSDWHKSIGEIFFSLLPAGSVSGTPKSSALEIIKKVEPTKRGYFCGVAGVYDGEKFRSFVLIRFIEKNRGTLYYKSGGGITIDSSAKKEYNELGEKVYVTF